MLTGSALFWPMEVSAGTQYGDGTWADGYNTAIGISARARGDGALALGTQTKATSIRSTAIGHQAEASGADSISIGTLSGASNTHSIAIGNKARAYGVDAIHSVLLQMQRRPMRWQLAGMHAQRQAGR